MGAVCNSSNKDPDIKHSIIHREDKKDKKHNDADSKIRYPEQFKNICNRKAMSSCYNLI